MKDPVTLSCAPLGPCRVVRARGAEAMSELPTFRVEVLSEDADVDLDALVLERAALALADDDGGPDRVVPLRVIDASCAGSSRDGHRYALELSSVAWPLTLRSGHRIFQRKTVPEIVAEVLKDAGIPADEVVWRLGGQYARRAQCSQYAESEWGFVERLLADEGIAYWLDAEDGEPRIVFGDDPASHEAIAGDPRVPFEDASGMAHAASSFFALARADELTPSAVHLREYDVRRPDVLVEGKAGEGALELFEFPARVPHAEAAAARAAVRLEQLQRLGTSMRGESHCTRLQPGRVVRIDGASDDAFDGDWLIVRVEHELAASSPNAVAERPYRNRAILVPRSAGGRDRTFRPAAPAAHPRIEGIETAVVTGPAGEEIHVDDLGSVKLAFRWDPSGASDASSSCWARTLQMNMGGAMLLPRVGWEVGVAYLDGDPDRPVVLGRAYNAVQAPPYPLPAAKATSALRSDTSPHDGSTNEIRFGDAAGSQEMFVHASNTQGVRVGGSATTTVGADETHDVKQGYAVHVVGAQTVSVGGSQRIAVGSDAQTAVKGARSEAIGATESIGVEANHRVETGVYTELVGALHGLQCNVAATTVQGVYTELVGGNLAELAGLGTHQSAAAARVEVVAGACNVVAGKQYAEDTMGAKSVSVGPVQEVAATDLATEAGAGDIHVRGSASLSAGGKIQIEAVTISIEIGGSLTARAGATLRGAGSLKADGGTTKLDAGTTARKSTSKVEA